MGGMRRCLVMVLMVAALAGLPDARALAAVVTPDPVPSVAETTPVATTGDSIDDAAIWVDPRDPAQSLVLGNNKRGALETYDLAGNRVQRITDAVTFWGNVDVRQSVPIAGTIGDIVAVYHNAGIQLYRIDPTTRLLSRVNEGTSIATAGEGVCLYSSARTGRLYVFAISPAGVVRQFEIRDTDGDGLLDGTLVRQFSVGSEAEGCVADDDNGVVYISEEDVALWRYPAEPDGGTTRTAVDTVVASGGHLAPDIEGVTLVDLPDGGGYVIASAQDGADPSHSYFVSYARRTGSFVRAFRVTNGTSSDDCDLTDGVAATYAAMGPAFPQGLFVCQDNNNDAPGTVGNQDLKYVPLQNVVDLGQPPPPPPTGITHVSATVVNANTRTWSRTVPASVRPGDGMILSFSSTATTDPLTGPGPGWTLLGTLDDGTLRTTHWQRVATAADPGSTIQVSFPSGYRKGALSLAVYRGTRTTVPFATAVGAPEPGTSASHTTPMATVPAGGAWRVSYWADRNSLASGWTAPAGELVRAVSGGTGGGRIGMLETDPGVGVPAGTTGGLTATSASASNAATAWTILLLP